MDATTLQPCGVLLEFHGIKKKSHCFCSSDANKVERGCVPGGERVARYNAVLRRDKQGPPWLVDLADVCYVRFCLIERL